jgi:hypothetical protein
MNAVSDEYEKNRAFGKPENIEKRLAMWSNQLSRDKTYPWVGLGLIDDLRCACTMLGGDPDRQYADMRKPKPVPNPEPAKVVEYDL